MNNDRKNILLTIAVLTTITTCAFARTYQRSPQDQELVNIARSAKKLLKYNDILSFSKETDSHNREYLKNLVDELQNLHLPGQQIKINTQSQQPKTENTEIDATDTQNENPDNKTTTPTTELSKHLISSLMTMLQEHPDNIVNPFAVAEAFFSQKDYTKAAKFYQFALKKMPDDREHPNKPWAMYQTANCLRYTDRDVAYQLYQDLIEQFPNSRWATTAKVQQELVDWYRSDQTKKILEKFINDPNSI